MANFLVIFVVVSEMSIWSKNLGNSHSHLKLCINFKINSIFNSVFVFYSKEHKWKLNFYIFWNVLFIPCNYSLKIIVTVSLKLHFCWENRPLSQCVVYFKKAFFPQIVFHTKLFIIFALLIELYKIEYNLGFGNEIFLFLIFFCIP
jgi:hypothetical protein